MRPTSRKSGALILGLGAVTLGALACAGESLPPPPQTNGQFAMSTGTSSAEPLPSEMTESTDPTFGGAAPTDDSTAEIPDEMDAVVEPPPENTDDSATDDSSEPANVNGAGLGLNPPSEPEPVTDPDPTPTDDSMADDSSADDSMDVASADDTSMGNGFGGGLPADDSASDDSSMDDPFGGMPADDSSDDDAAADDGTMGNLFGGGSTPEPEDPAPTTPTGPGGSPTPECTNIRPTGTDWDEGTCDGWATETTECDSDWMIDNNYCNESCGRC